MVAELPKKGGVGIGQHARRRHGFLIQPHRRKKEA
jgi:hypothetical protein